MREVEEGYRTPAREEFVRGFKFEWLQRTGGGSFFIWSFDKTKEDIQAECDKNRFPIKEEWTKHQIPKSMRLSFNPDWDLWFSLDHAIENNLVRVKI